jgi:hypothetical protein
MLISNICTKFYYLNRQRLVLLDINGRHAVRSANRTLHYDIANLFFGYLTGQYISAQRFVGSSMVAHDNWGVGADF